MAEQSFSIKYTYAPANHITPHVDIYIRTGPRENRVALREYILICKPCSLINSVLIFKFEVFNSIHFLVHLYRYKLKAI